MHSWHIAFQDLFPSLNLIPSKNVVSNAFSQILVTKEFSEGKYFTNEPHCYGAILYFLFIYIYSFEKSNSRKRIISTSYLFGLYYPKFTLLVSSPILQLNPGLVSKHIFKDHKWSAQFSFKSE
jgi:hypothetical protein